MRITTTTGRAAAAAALLLAPMIAPAHVDAGVPVENAELAALDGSRHALLVKNQVNVLVFFRPEQERSIDTLQRLAECERLLAAKPVHLVPLVSSSAPAAAARAAVEGAGIQSPVLVDQSDELYGKLELRQHPMIVIVDRKWTVHAFEPYQRLRYCEIVRARVRFLLGELDQAAVEKIVKPPRADFPTEVAGGSAGRYVKLGNRELAKGNCEYALKAFDHALERDPANAGALAGKAKCQGAGALPAKKGSPGP
jgi:hypothetical protein